VTPGQIASYNAARAEYITASDHATDDAAHHVAARLIATMPADLTVYRYRVGGNNVDGQLNAGFHADSSARLLRIAEQFGLDYAETAYDNGRLDLSARGVINGVNVRFWDNVPALVPAVPTCHCNCHGSAMTV
jgi:hypothetical protein